MTNKTHIVSGVAVSLTATYFFKDLDLNLAYVMLGTLIGSQLPDLDSDRSWITQTFPYPYKFLKNTKKLYYKNHRTVLLHSFYTVYVMIFLTVMIKNNIFTGLGLGMITHILFDRIKIIKIKCNSVAETCVYLLSLMLIVINLYLLFAN